MKYIILLLFSFSIFSQKYTLDVQEIDTLACNDHVRLKNTFDQNRKLLKNRNIIIKEKSTFSKEELDLIVEAVYLYPAYLFKNNFTLNKTISFEYKDKVMVKNHKYTKMSNGSRKFERVLVEAIAKADKDIDNRTTIEVGRMWRKSSYKSRVYTIFHELAHVLNYNHTTLFINLNDGWHSVYFGRRLNPKDRSKFVSSYAQSNSNEDWAESLSAYRLNPKLLKSRSIEKYNFIKDKVFFGIDYLKEESCQNRIIESRDVISDKAKKHIDFAITNRLIYRALRKKRSSMDKITLVFKMMDQYFNHVIYRSWDKRAYLNSYRESVDVMMELNSLSKQVLQDYFFTLESKFIQKLID